MSEPRRRKGFHHVTKCRRGPGQGYGPFTGLSHDCHLLKDKRKEANKTSFSLYVPLMCKHVPQLHSKGAKPIHPIGTCWHTVNFASNFHHRGSSYSVSQPRPLILLLGLFKVVHFKIRAESFVLYSQSYYIYPDKAKSSINMLFYFEVGIISQVAAQIKNLCFLSQSATHSQTKSSGLSISSPIYV